VPSASVNAAPLEVAAVLRSSPDLTAVLQSAAGAIARGAGYEAVVINLYRPAWHDFEVVAVHGTEESYRALMHTSSTAEWWARLFDPRFKRGDAYFIPAGEIAYEEDEQGVWFVPDIEASDDPDAWDPHDALFVPLLSGSGQTIGVLSVDEPVSGRRPGEQDLETLKTVAEQAALAVESAQQAAQAAAQRAALEHLLRVSAELTRPRALDDVLRVVCDGIGEALGFARVMLCLTDEDGGFRARAMRGWNPDEVKQHFTWSEFAPVLSEGLERDGCVLLSREDAHALVPPSLHGFYRSVLNGRGPHAWNGHWLMVPLRDSRGELAGCVWADDPIDRLLPSRERLQALRAFANQAAGAVETARRRAELEFLAAHDPMTGLRNRRELPDLVAGAVGGPEGGAVVMVDVDRFKRINDSLGHERGDEVIVSVARVIADACGDGDCAVRLGGEEFALVLPGRSEVDAVLIAESVRRAASTLDLVPWGLTLSAGVTVGAAGDDPDDVLRRAARALAAAKRRGRDCCVVWADGMCESDDGASADSGSAARERLAAVLLLAETLDLRDAGTADHSRTVGEYAEAVAKRMGFPEEGVERLRVAGILHDLGKLGIADATLHKAGPLDDHEWAEIRRHPEIGARILAHAGLADLAAWVLAHHERWDGRGYPNAIAATDIPLEARILAVVDAYEAMTGHRPYRPVPMTHADARAELLRCAGSQFDPAVVDAFLDAVEPPAEPAAPLSSRCPVPT
jgi:diguanylate cyclase (GGDEF)-like protein